MSNSSKPNLRDGSEWVEHEDCIVGDEAGLKNLIHAAQSAIDKGQHYGEGLGDYVGVKCVESEWFKDPMDSRSTKVGNAILGVCMLVLAGLVLLGFATAVSWLFSTAS